MSDVTGDSTIDAGASEAAGVHTPGDDGSTPSPATNEQADEFGEDVVPTDLSVGVNTQGQPIPHSGDGPVPVSFPDAQVFAAHEVNGTHTRITVTGAGEGRHLVEVRVTPVLPSGDRFRNAFSGDSCEFTVEGLAVHGVGTVTNLQGDGRPQDVGNVPGTIGPEVRFEVAELDAGAVTPEPDPGLADAPSVAFAAEPPTEAELEEAQQVATAQRAEGDAADAGVPADEAYTQPPGSGAESLGAPEGDQPQQSPAPPSLSLPGAVDVNGDPLPDPPAGDGTPG